MGFVCGPMLSVCVNMIDQVTEHIHSVTMSQQVAHTVCLTNYGN